ncbi:hypothetical protein [Brevibacillus laterosporus]|uniref:Uncharacterized protein n=1 Tax=Brevibacillus laterosporus TaxID=1465 RepID=A0AAP3DE37_BRELA|nr:hypothetical protein [Brevibacillus laterosporus]MCR8979554.1 hypothetical protein [Brevibacillus laterosporus]MCZ0806709.1 hypothetical protein [Brevibacillus laterosporus]MCZ0828505.1 hypothetical protein [Brevibacillus laterosporus]MCZ0852575.1 hypothetical protein [Brevibacillus laterosporus]
MEKKLSRDEIIGVINNILSAKGTEEEEATWLEQLSVSVPYYQEIYRIIVTSKEDLTAEDILEKAKQNHSPIH